MAFVFVLKPMVDIKNEVGGKKTFRSHKQLISLPRRIGDFTPFKNSEKPLVFFKTEVGMRAASVEISNQ